MLLLEIAQHLVKSQSTTVKVEELMERYTASSSGHKFNYAEAVDAVWPYYKKILKDLKKTFGKV